MFLTFAIGMPKKVFANWRKWQLKIQINYNRFDCRLGKCIKNFTTLHKLNIVIKLCLKCIDMCLFVGPVPSISNC